MSICVQCGFQNPEDVHICLRCASLLRRQCPVCGGDVPAENRFCGHCGSRMPEPSLTKSSPAASGIASDPQEQMLLGIRQKMPSSLVTKITQAAAELSGQRREVTVLFVNVVNYLKAAQVLDSEDLYLATDEIMQVLATLIYKYEGTIDKFTGDGLMALFGLPLNHENDPERALRAALEMQHAIQSKQEHYKQRYRIEFRVRVGINTGSLIAGYMGNQQHLEYTVIGDTVNLAARLQQAAQPGGILVSFSTYQRSRPIFEFKALEPFQPKGIAYQVYSFQPVSVRLKPGQVRGLPGLQVPLIGRTRDIDVLMQAIQQIRKAGATQVVLCSGDAGIGKTRLMTEMSNALVSEAVKTYQGTCAAYMRITPYRVVGDLVRNMIRVSEIDPENVQKEALRQRLEQLGLDQNDILPYLLHVLGLLHSEPFLEVRIKLLEPSMLQRQIHLALRTLFLAEARLSPTIIIFDDLHWVDQASREFIEYLCQSLEDFPLLLVLIARDFSGSENVQQIYLAANRRGCQPVEICLKPLSTEDSLALADQLIRENTPKARSIKSTVIERAAGNPFYLEELVRILIDEGGLVFHDGGWEVTVKANEILQTVPGTLQDIILARFDRLPEHLQLTLQKASILGQSFATSLLQIIVDEKSEMLLAYLDALEEREFLIHAHFGVGEGFIFKHPLVQSTIYNTLLRRNLRKYHFQIAEAIETGDYWLSGERNEILAHHFAESSMPARAIPYLLTSAEKASHHFANETVIQLYRRALQLMENVPEVSAAQVFQTKVGLAQALKFTGELEEANRLLDETVKHYLDHPIDVTRLDINNLKTMVEGFRELADLRAREGEMEYAVQLLKTGLDNLGETGRALYPTAWRRLADRLAWVYFRQSRLEEAYSWADLALLNVSASEADDPTTLASLHNTMGGVYWTRSRFSEAIDCVQRSLTIYKDLNYHWGMAVSLTNLGVLHYSLGKWNEAVNDFEQADHLRSEYGYDPERPITLKNLGEVLLVMGDLDGARSKLTASREMSKKLRLTMAQSYAELGLCRLAVVEGNFVEAGRSLEEARKLLEPFDEPNDRIAQFHQLAAWIEAHYGNYAKALEYSTRSLQIAEQGDFIDEKIEALLVSGEVCLKLGDWEKAETCLQEALQLAQQQNHALGEGQALAALGTLCLNRTDSASLEKPDWRAQANQFIERAAEKFEALGARHELRRAQALRARLAAINGGQSQDLISVDEVQTEISALRDRLGLPDGEWYLATVVSIILAPRQDIDEEFIFETITFFVPPLISLIQENGGQVLHQQDRITAIFGSPVAHEDDPERAVETAMNIANFFNETDQQTNLPITLRLGISMGKIVAGRVGMGPESEFIAAGEPLQLALRIALVGQPVKVWVTQEVRNATSFRFEYSPVPLSLTPTLTDTTIFQLEGVREQIIPVRGLIGLKTPFVGRSSELAVMGQIRDALQAGEGGVIWVEGEAGIGKSRLMREFAARVAQQEMIIFHGACTIRRMDIAFSLFSDLLSQAFDIQHNSTADQIYQRLNDRLQTWPQELMETKPFIELLLGVQPAGAQGERVAALEPEQLRRQTFVAINRVISLLAARKPVMILLDDLQWIDSISAELLLYLSHMIISNPVLFVCAKRQNETSPYEKILMRTLTMHPDRVVQLLVQPLTLDECWTLLDEFLDQTQVSKEVKSLIIQQSGGNPYFIEEFVRMMVEKDYLRISRGRLESNQAIHIDALSIPSSLEALIRARVDALQPNARQILQIASVTGRRFSRSLLEKISKRKDLSIYLDLLAHRGMLNRVADDELWEFSHPLIETIVYNTVLRAQRKMLHSQTASALEQQWQGKESEHAEELAYHFGKAEEYNRNLYYLTLAGERAAARHANDMAVAFFEQATDLLSAVPETTDELRWRIIAGLGEVYLFIGNYEASLAALQNGLDLVHSSQLSRAQRAGLYRRIGDTASKKGDPDLAIVNLNNALEILQTPTDTTEMAEAARIYARLTISHFRKANLDAAEEAIRKSEAFARQSNNLNALATACNQLGGIYYRRGELDKAVENTQQAMASWQEIGYTWGVAVSLSNLGILEVASGNWNAAFLAFQKSMKMRKDMGDVEGMAINFNNLGTLARDQGDMQQAESYLHDSLAISRPFQMNWHTANSSMGLAQVLLYQNRLDEADEELRKGLRLAEEINARDLFAEMQMVDAEILLARARFLESEQTANKAITLAKEIDSHPLMAGSWRIIASCRLQQGKTEQAQQALDQAWKALSGGSDELEFGRVHAQATLVCMELRDTEQAYQHYTQAKVIFERLGAARDLSLLNTAFQI